MRLVLPFDPQPNSHDHFNFMTRDVRLLCKSCTTIKRCLSVFFFFFVSNCLFFSVPLVLVLYL
jgi:hypothetical protein